MAAVSSVSNLVDGTVVVDGSVVVVVEGVVKVVVVVVLGVVVLKLNILSNFENEFKCSTLPYPWLSGNEIDGCKSPRTSYKYHLIRWFSFVISCSWFKPKLFC